MSNDISSIYGNLFTNNLLNSSSNSSTGATTTGGTSSELMIGMMMGMMASQSGDSTSDSSSSYSSGFNVMLNSLLTAMNNKNKQASEGLAINAAGANTTSNSTLEALNQLVFRNLTGATAVSNSNLSSAPESERIQNAITSASSKYSVSESLIKAVIQVESNYNTNAVSSAGAMGLMQLMPSTAASYGATDPYNIEQNIDAGTHLLSNLLKQFNNNTAMALAGYNYGTGNLASRGITSTNDFYKLPTETKNYVTKIDSILNA